MGSSAIKVVADDFDAAYAKLVDLKSSLENYKTELERSYAAMKADWFGAAAGAFDAHVPKLLKDYDALLAKMGTAAEDIRQTGEAVRVQDLMISEAMQGDRPH
ncbi:MAG: WXG100 family type VII secretion target [Clostridiales Family XIII bacterium]|jgi:uncharacterized protein YukE|nr:WXG100 family type VII secretion target [Clostridiales Family XIII bacterium]